jgi:hypothetical protein
MKIPSSWSTPHLVWPRSPHEPTAPFPPTDVLEDWTSEPAAFERVTTKVIELRALKMARVDLRQRLEELEIRVLEPTFECIVIRVQWGQS